MKKALLALCVGLLVGCGGRAEVEKSKKEPELILWPINIPTRTYIDCPSTTSYWDDLPSWGTSSGLYQERFIVWAYNSSGGYTGAYSGTNFMLVADIVKTTYNPNRYTHNNHINKIVGQAFDSAHGEQVFGNCFDMTPPIFYAIGPNAGPTPLYYYNLSEGIATNPANANVGKVYLRIDAYDYDYYGNFEEQTFITYDQGYNWGWWRMGWDLVP